ncbi:MAG: class I SAM-dependent methyltransferase [Ardenticatenia bacterium]|nr:MAG: class I SAM-dependent methyltransferase [Ardenticatenia bacterium]
MPMFEQAYAPRWRKALKIKTILQDAYPNDLSQARVLDIGCGNGAITNALAHDVAAIVGTDIDGTLIAEAQAHAAPNATFLQSDGAALPFADEQFDIVICAQVYEHAHDRPALVREIERVLRPGGYCFFSGPNKLAVLEEHYWLPFLSWFPQSIADAYVRITKRGDEYDVWPMTYWQLRRLWCRFTILDYTPKLLHAPQRFGVEDELGRLYILTRLPFAFWRFMAPFLPNFNWVLVKQS